MPRVRAPELSQTAPWINSRPLSLKTLRGRVVVLDFWTYGCINCLHVLADLRFLEAKYGNQLVVIGVHTPKFDHEHAPEAVQQAVHRYGIAHPVVVDGDRVLWDQYAVRAWPTFVVIDPQGYVVATRSGEGQRQALDALIHKLTAAIDLHQSPPEEPPGPEIPAAEIHDEVLAFPSAVLAAEDSDMLVIADTGHHRLLITTLAGRLRSIIGSGIAGWQNGPFHQAQFHSPHGMAWDSSQQHLYVADTGNHLIRRVDLAQQQVTTVGGTGHQSQWLFPHGGRALEVGLNSPWDLVQRGDSLYIAMAGAHQIWQLNLGRATVQTLMGTGAEFCVDGTVDVAAFAQPSGITTDGQALFVADSETSSIRALSITDPPTVRTLCGSGQLFVFGDQDGVGTAARLQHCLGVVWDEGYVWIADTYNHKIKRLDLATGACLTPWPVGMDLAEPSGLAITPHHLYVADTNHHAIRRICLTSGDMETVAIAAVCTPDIPCDEDLTAMTLPSASR